MTTEIATAASGRTSWKKNGQPKLAFHDVAYAVSRNAWDVTYHVIRLAINVFSACMSSRMAFRASPMFKDWLFIEASLGTSSSQPHHACRQLEPAHPRRALEHL